MKKIAGFALVSLTLFLFSFRTLFSIDAVATAIRSGMLRNWLPNLDYRVDIALPDKSDTYSKRRQRWLSVIFCTMELQIFRSASIRLYCVSVIANQNGKKITDKPSLPAFCYRYHFYRVRLYPLCNPGREPIAQHPRANRGCHSIDAE